MDHSIVVITPSGNAPALQRQVAYCQLDSTRVPDDARYVAVGAELEEVEDLAHLRVEVMTSRESEPWEEIWTQGVPFPHDRQSRLFIGVLYCRDTQWFFQSEAHWVTTPLDGERSDYPKQMQEVTKAVTLLRRKPPGYFDDRTHVLHGKANGQEENDVDDELAYLTTALDNAEAMLAERNELVRELESDAALSPRWPREEVRVLESARKDLKLWRAEAEAEAAEADSTRAEAVGCELRRPRRNFTSNLDIESLWSFINSSLEHIIGSISPLFLSVEIILVALVCNVYKL
jgi:hypothetical protein